ncbi:MAG TPA: hypothetical protein VF433_01045 [Cellvibrio sp.]
MAERTIVNYGVYQFEEEEKQAYRLRVYTQVIRHPDTEYQNLKYQKYQGFYGYAQLMNGNHVHQTIQLQYENECILELTQSDNLNTFIRSSQVYGILQSIANLANALGATAVINPIDPPLYPIAFDRVVFKLHSNTTLLVYTDIEPLPTLEVMPALPWDEPSDDPEPLSDTQPVPNPLDEPYDIPSPPYDPLTADNGETYNPQVPEPVYEGVFTARITFTNPLIAPGSITWENTLTNPDAEPERQFTDYGSSGRVRLVWGFEGGQWVIDQTDAGYDLLDQIQIISSELIPIP